MKTILFWGAGRIGERMLELWRQFGMQPDFFADNSQERWGTFYHGIRILSIDEMKDKEEVQVLITCNQIDKVSALLVTWGIPSENIYKGNTIHDMLRFWMLHMNGKVKWDTYQNKKAEQKEFCVLFDVQSGFVLGGVEAWALQMADILSEQGMKVKHLTTDMSGYIAPASDEKVIQLQYQNEPSEIGRLQKSLTAIRENTPCNVVCNFPFYNFHAACIAKLLWPKAVNLIAVVHSDEDVYYERYSSMHSLIDYCLVTCDMMEKRFIQNEMKQEKILRLAWHIPCNKVLCRTYSGEDTPIRIGYAGRINKGQKRLDLLVEILGRLKDANVDFRMEVAGTGDYEEEMKKKLSDMTDKVYFCGQINREQIPGFWERQDIGINCSVVEGRCISRAESMAAGAVPVITDTSSAGDDVEDGYNGYIVPVGDVEAFVNRICYLYYHRELLEEMGKRSHQVILRQNEENDVMNMWNKILIRDR